MLYAVALDLAVRDQVDLQVSRAKLKAHPSFTCPPAVPVGLSRVHALS